MSVGDRRLLRCTSPADGFANEKSGPLMLFTPAWVVASITRLTIVAAVVIDRDSLAAQRLIRCLGPFGPTRIPLQLVLIDSVRIPDAGTPRPRTASTMAFRRRFAADSAAADVGAERVSDSDRDATSGITITDPWPFTVSAPDVDASSSAAGAKLSDIRATTAAIRACAGNPLDQLTEPRELYT